MTNVTWGILGAARIAINKFIPGLVATPGARLAAVATRSETHAAEIRVTFPEVTVYTSYDQLLADAAIDAVYIPLPNTLHTEWVLRSVAAGKHVLCEKPLALSADEVRQMAEAADRAGVIVSEAFMYRYHTQTRALGDLVRAGEIGRPRYVQASFSYNLTGGPNIRLDPQLGGGALNDVGCYCVDVSRYIFDEEPGRVSGIAHWRNGVDVSFAGTLEFSSGFASFNCSMEAADREYLHVVGSDAVLVVPKPFKPEPGGLIEILHENKAEARRFEPEIAFSCEIRGFNGAIRDGAPLPLTLAGSEQNAKTLQRLHEAAGPPT